MPPGATTAEAAPLEQNHSKGVLGLGLGGKGGKKGGLLGGLGGKKARGTDRAGGARRAGPRARRAWPPGWRAGTGLAVRTSA